MAPDLGTNSYDEASIFGSDQSGGGPPTTTDNNRNKSKNSKLKESKQSISSNVTQATRPSSFASIIQHSPGATQCNSIVSSGRISQQSMGYMKTPQGDNGGVRRKLKAAAPPKTNSLGSSKGGTGGGGESSDGEFGGDYTSPVKQTSGSTTSGPTGWLIDNDGAEAPHPEWRPDPEDFGGDNYLGNNEYSDHNKNSSQRSQRTSQRSARSAPPKWSSTRIINKEDIKETELSVFVMAFMLIVMTTAGLGCIVLFVFGAAKSKDTERIVQSQLEYLSDDPSVFDNPESPQSLAVNWLAVKDESGIDVMEDTLRREQRYALAVLYFAFDGPPRLVDDLNFLSADHECQWNDDATDGDDEIVGASCEDGSRITEVRIGTYFERNAFCALLFARRLKYAANELLLPLVSSGKLFARHVASRNVSLVQLARAEPK
jgi:hypothetical protein